MKSKIIPALIVLLMGTALASCTAEPPEKTLFNEQIQQPNGYEVLDDSELRVMVQTGDDACTGHRLEVIETASSVTATAIQGSRSKEPQICHLVAGEEVLTADLKTPLGDRALIITQAEGHRRQQFPDEGSKPAVILAKQVFNPTTLRLTMQTGDPECSTIYLDHQETAKNVTVDARNVTNRGQELSTCPDTVRTVMLEVKLEQPLGDREIVHR